MADTSFSIPPSWAPVASPAPPAPVPTGRPSRRGVLLLLGVGAVAPVAIAALGAAADHADVDGLRFAVLAVGRQALPGHHHPSGPVSPFEAASWPDVVRVRLRVSNLGAQPLMVSPGQFRLRVQGLSVMPTGWLHGATALAAGDSRTGWIDYRAPAGPEVLALEFTPAGGVAPVSVPLAVPGAAA